MTVAALYLPQTLALVALSFLTGLVILIGRSVDLLRRERGIAFYEEFSGLGAPGWVTRPTRQLANQFEFPVLFFILVALLVAIPVQDQIIATLAWCYVGLRWAHAICQITVNRLYIRTPLFMIGNLVLLTMWGRLAAIIFAG